MDRETQQHHIPTEELVRVTMTVDFLVSSAEVKHSFGHNLRSAVFSFDCQSEVQTDEKTYASHQKGQKCWGFYYYWEKMYGAEEPQIA